MSRIYVSGETDPYFNVAAEYQLFMEAGPDTRLFLWRNRPSVIIGRNQNVFAECDTEFLRRHGISPVRRFSGGGAVYHDLGNVNYTFLSREEDADTGRYLKVIRDALLSVGVECSFSGRNDLLAGGRKFSGQAYYADHGNLLWHGTLMIDVDLGMLTGALKPSFLKLSSKGIDSVSSRVVNLSDIGGGITPEKAIGAVTGAFAAEYGTDTSVRQIDGGSMRPSILGKIRSDDWIYGQSPDFEVNFDRRLSFGNVGISADISGGRISRLKIYTDSLAAIDFTHFERESAGLPFDEKLLITRLEEFAEKCVEIK